MRYDFLVVAGPTASGKSALGICLAERLNGEIICADSVQVYKYLDIGTAKPTLAERAHIPHHIVDFLELEESYSAARFQKDAYAAIEDICARGKFPVVVGGTGLYVNAVRYPMRFTEAASDPDYRTQLQALSSQELHLQLQKLDPATAVRLHPNDRVRIVRALEVIHLSGKPFSAQVTDYKAQKPRYQSLLVAPDLPRETLYARIDDRALQMMDAGWQAELEHLLAQGYDPYLRPLQTLGYRQISAMLRGELPEEELIPLIQRDTRRFAKRQLTWYRGLPDIQWLDMSMHTLEQCAEQIIKMLGEP